LEEFVKRFNRLQTLPLDGGPAGLQSTSGNSCYDGSGSSFSAGYSRNNGVQAGPTYGSYQVIPLYGGSGGGGGWDNTTGQLVGGIGGAGGGAIRIASTTQITTNGTINANGGNNGNASSSSGNTGCAGGEGAGGTIHLVAPVIAGSGYLSAISGSGPGVGPYADGLLRFSMNSSTYSGGSSPGIITGPLYLPPANSTLSQPSLSITSVNGVAVPAQAAGSSSNPDVTIASLTPVTVNIAAANIPLGTVVNLRITAETGPDASISCNALAGALASSTAIHTATFPYAVSIAGIRATW
jgi:hypothetical protein